MAHFLHLQLVRSETVPTQPGVPSLPRIRLPGTAPSACKPGVHNCGSVPGALRACNGDREPWVTRHTPHTQICTQDTEESVVAHFIFSEQINFPPQPSSVEISVCPDTRMEKSIFDSAGFIGLARAHQLSFPGPLGPGPALYAPHFRPGGGLRSVPVCLPVSPPPQTPSFSSPSRVARHL